MPSYRFLLFLSVTNVLAFKSAPPRTNFRNVLQVKEEKRGVDWCDYWLAHGKLHERPECVSMLQLPATKPPTTTTTTEAPIPLCINKFMKSSCVPDDRCESGKLCTEMLSSQCCHPPRGICPTPAQIGFSCMVQNPTSWCESDVDCGNKDQRCCPTGCKYSICI